LAGAGGASQREHEAIVEAIGVGDPEAAEKAVETMNTMVEIFEEKQLKPYILRRIKAEAEAEKAALREEQP
jgi:DNA-binding FadR family transcriptional regulator